MNQEERADPKELLKAVEAFEKRPQGKLKVFLGMSAGVGKTYSMLEDAKKKIAEGLDVAIAILCTHGRKDTAKLAEGIRVIAQKKIYYKNKVFEELDLEEVVRQKPDIVLIDELAHTNIPGSKHIKRWQDVVEVLQKGIDVYTTVNIQHIESYKDVAEQIFGIPIKETVPDHVLENADNIEVIDLTPQELLERFKEGKVYTGNLPLVAVQNYFKEDKLTALREIVLRFSADVVDEELQRMNLSRQRGKSWSQRERLLVLINARIESEEIIRITKRIAFALHAPWIALNIDKGGGLSEEENTQLSKNLSLARDLGAEVIEFSCLDSIQGITTIIKQKNITQVYAYKYENKSIFNFFKKSLVDRLAAKVDNIDIHIVRKQSIGYIGVKPGFKDVNGIFKQYGIISLLVLFIAILGLILSSLVSYAALLFIFLLSVIIFGFYFSRGPLIYSALVYGLIGINYLAPKYHETGLVFQEAIISTSLFLVVSIVTSLVISNAKLKEEVLLKREKSLSLLNEIMKQIAGSRTFEEVFEGVKEKVSQALDGACLIIINPLDAATYFEDEKERAVASYAFENGVEVGWSTSTLPLAKYIYIPLKSYRGIVGVLAFRPINTKVLLPNQLNFLHTVSQLIANYFERHFREEREREIKSQIEIEKTYENVLSAIALKLKTPLNNIKEALVELKKSGPLEPISRVQVSLSILQSISDNAYEMARLSSGFMHFQKEPTDINLIVNQACGKLKNELNSFKLILSIQEELPLINCDKDLVEVCLISFLKNSIGNAPPSSTIEIEAKNQLNLFILTVIDEGPGIPENLKNEIFNKFYSVPGSYSSGLGLGLSIAKSIATLHDATIEVVNRPQKGLKVSFIMPI